LIRSVAASRPAAITMGLRFNPTHKCTHEFAINFRCDRISVNALCSQKFTGIFRPVNTGRYDLDLVESGRGKLVTVVSLVQGTCGAQEFRTALRTPKLA